MQHQATRRDGMDYDAKNVSLASARQQGRRSHLAWPCSRHDQSCARPVHAIRCSDLIPAAAPQHLAARPYAEDAACTCLQLGSLAASLFRSTWSGAPQAPKLQCVYEARGYSETRTYCKVGANDAAAVQRVECNLRHIRSSVFYCSCSTNAPGSVRLMLSNLAHAYAVVR